MTGEAMSHIGVLGLVAMAAYLILAGHLVPRRSVDAMRDKLRDQAERNQFVPAMRRTHLGHEIVPVESVVTGEILARLCVDCGEQLPAWNEGGLVSRVDADW